MTLALGKEGSRPCFYHKDRERERRDRQEIEAEQPSSLSFSSTYSVPALELDQLCVLLGGWDLGVGEREKPFFRHRGTTPRHV